jgi:curved DNA-binding protein CbpA
MIDYYRVLSIRHDASVAEIKRVYRRVSLVFHPETNKMCDAREKFIQIQEAYAILSDTNLRIEHNNLLMDSWRQKERDPQDRKASVLYNLTVERARSEAIENSSDYRRFKYSVQKRTLPEKISIIITNSFGGKPSTLGGLIMIFSGAICLFCSIKAADEKKILGLIFGGMILIGAGLFFVRLVVKEIIENENDTR